MSTIMHTIGPRTCIAKFQSAISPTLPQTDIERNVNLKLTPQICTHALKNAAIPAE